MILIFFENKMDKLISKNLHLFCLTVYLIAFVNKSFQDNESNNAPGLPIAIIYDKNNSAEIINLIDKAIWNINNAIVYGRNRWSVQIRIIETGESHELFQTVCNQMSRGVLAIFGDLSMSTVHTLTDLTNFYNLPFLTWARHTKMPNSKSEIKKKRNILTRLKRFQANDNTFDVLNYPDYYEAPDLTTNEIKSEKLNSNMQLYFRIDFVPALIELIRFYEWKTVYYIYNYDEAILNIESLFDRQNKDSKFVENIILRKVVDIHDCRDLLRAIEVSFEDYAQNNENKIVMILDLASKQNYMYFLSQIKDLGMTKNRYFYLLATLGIYELDLNEFRHGGASFVGFSVVDYYNMNSIRLLSDLLQPGEPLNKIPNIPHEAALLIDAILYFTWKMHSVMDKSTDNLFGFRGVSLRKSEIYVNKTKGIECSYSLNSSLNKWILGNYVINLLKKNSQENSYDGVTGRIEFDTNGKRINYTLGIYKVGLNLPLKKIGFFSEERGLHINEEKSIRAEKKHDPIKPKVVISILDPPFFMIRPKEAGENFVGNDRYEGYCADLAKKISEIVNFTYEIRPVKDNSFGNRYPNGSWNGVVGELIRHEADIAVAPLTITSQRERAIEFSMPFMDIGISIMIKKPKKEKPGVFSFMSPLDSKIWICVILAFAGVSVVLYLVSRFSPYEWHYDPSKNENSLNNDFTILNTLWFNLAAVMQQGVDITPKSVSGRLVASVWWFFTLILISSYTANLAAFLTVERMISPIESVEQLSRQTEIQYGALEGGSTQEFFRTSKVDTYQRMWNFMQSWSPSVFVKTNAEGVQKVRDSKGKYAYLLESSLNEYLNEREPCDTIKVGNNLDSKGYGIATPIRSKMRDPINLAILQLKEEGYLDELKTRWWYDKSKCGTSGSATKDSSQSALNLINVAGTFYILILGLILSILVAGCELMYKARKQSKKKNIEFTEAIKSKMRISISGYDESIMEFQDNRN